MFLEISFSKLQGSGLIYCEPKLWPGLLSSSPSFVPSLQWKGSGMTYERKAKAKSECCHEKKDNAKQNLLGGFMLICDSIWQNFFFCSTYLPVLDGFE